jgi:hypothetical protein
MRFLLKIMANLPSRTAATPSDRIIQACPRWLRTPEVDGRP